jgi:hypothetical protein
MPATKTELDSQLEHLRLDVANLNVLRKLTREQEQRVMGEVFVWWQQARQVEGYLEQCYAEHKIDYNKTQGTVNFRPLLRLVTNNEITATDLDTWSQAFPKILEDVEKSPKHYANNPAGKIAHFVKQKGGKRALAGYYNSRTSVYEPEADAEIQPSLLFTLDDAEFLPLLKSASRQYYAVQANTQLLNIPTAKANAEGYSMILVRHDGQQTGLVGSTANTKIIEELLISTYRNDFEALPLTMRVILEPLHIMNVPNSIGDNAEKFIEVSNLKDAWNVGKKELAVKRMIYRSESRDFVISCQQVPSSVVLIAKPHKEIMSHEYGDTFLSNATRKSIETRLLYQQTFSLFAPSSADKFKKTQPPGISAASVSLHTKLPIDDSDGITEAQIITHTENLKHSPISFIPFYESFGEPRWQVTNKSDDFETTWQANLDLDWLRHASNRFFEQWIKHYGKKATRLVNKLLQVKLLEDQIVIGFEFDKTLGIDNSVSIPLFQKSATGQAELKVRSSDFAFVLRQIADLNVTSAIKIKADNYALALNFQTTASSYECWIPACDENANRLTMHFTIYRPTTSKGLELSEEPENEQSDLTEEEQKQLQSNTLRLAKRESA